MPSLNLKEKILIALSGGVDSAISAYLLLKQGYHVEGVFMKNWSATEGLVKNDCPWLEDRRDALRVAAFLGISLHTLDFEKQYQKLVMKKFFTEYKAGRTPNPDILCNQEIKFGLLYEWAKKQGFDYLATGHYAQVYAMSSSRKRGSSTMSRVDSSLRGNDREFLLLRSVDEFKDQTYFIYRLNPKQMSSLLFPIGSMKKTEVKKLATKIGLPNANRKESMGLCFVGKIRLQDFLAQKLKPRPGKIVLVRKQIHDVIPTKAGIQNREMDSGSRSQTRLSKMTKAGQVIGEHKGLHNYTIGQRHGVSAVGTRAFYVVKKDLKSNTLYVTDNPEDEALYVKQVEIKDLRWLVSLELLNRLLKFQVLDFKSKKMDSKISYPFLARFRHQGVLAPTRFLTFEKNKAVVEFKTKQKALASGQSLVVYLDTVCLGGGFIV